MDRESSPLEGELKAEEKDKRFRQLIDAAKKKALDMLESEIRTLIMEKQHPATREEKLWTDEEIDEEISKVQGAIYGLENGTFGPAINILKEWQEPYPGDRYNRYKWRVIKILEKAQGEDIN